MKSSAAQRFWSGVDKSGDCWIWTRSTSDTGYGCFHDGRAYSTHRYSWILHNGPIPPGMCVLHRCDNRPCVRPDHLFLGTKRDNSIDMASKGRGLTPCLKGEAHGEARLTDYAVCVILTSPETGRALASRFGVSESAVSLVRRGRTWVHITPEIAARRLDQGVLDFGDTA